jgi:hypothetical protein
MIMTESMNAESPEFLAIDDLETEVGAFGTQEATGLTTDGVIIDFIVWLL